MRIVLATFGSHGDVHPFIGLGITLRERGHEVVVHTSGMFESLVGAAGLGFSAFQTAEHFRRQLKHPLIWHPTKGYKAIFGDLVGENLEASYLELKRIVTPETVLVGSSLAFSARVVQDELGCPGATVHLAPSVIRSSIAPPRLPGVFMPSWMPMFVRTKVWEIGDERFVDPLICPALNALRAKVGLPPVSRVLNGWWNHPGRVIGMWPDWYGPAASDWPSQFRHAGFPLYDESDVTPLPAELDAFLAGGDAPIAFTPGSAMVSGQRFFGAAVDACRRLGKRGLLLTRHAEQIPSDLPAGVVHVAYAPFGKLLPRCAAIVHHGGIGTTSQAIRAGIPQVITHFSHDQPDNAQRLARLGVGTGLAAKSISGRKVAKPLARLLADPLVGRACAATARRELGDGLARGADLIEDVGASVDARSAV
jgi:UDP:flavonoid glycosyltransferase YjiC (YdhE family)